MYLLLQSLGYKPESTWSPRCHVWRCWSKHGISYFWTSTADMVGHFWHQSVWLGARAICLTSPVWL